MALALDLLWALPTEYCNCGGFPRLQAVALPTGVAQTLKEAFYARAQWGLCSLQAGKVTAVHVLRLVSSARSLSDFGARLLGGQGR